MRSLAFVRHFWVLPGLVITSMVSTLLLVLHLTGWRGSNEMIATLNDYQSFIVLAVQAISQILGLLLVLALCVSPLLTGTSLGRALTFNRLASQNAFTYRCRQRPSQPRIRSTVEFFITFTATIFVEYGLHSIRNLLCSPLYRPRTHLSPCYQPTGALYRD